MKKPIKEYREEIQRAFDSQGTWGDRWKQWETILRQLAEDMREECAGVCDIYFHDIAVKNIHNDDVASKIAFAVTELRTAIESIKIE